MSRVCIENFRCYNEPTEFRLGDLACVIGRNDIGKSALLDALDAFFNDSIDKHDLCTTATSNEIVITCYFEDLPPSLVLDTAVETTLSQESMLNENGELQIKRVFKIGKTLTKATYIVAHYPENQALSGLLSLINSDLKRKAADVEAELTNVDSRKNPDLRQAIRTAVGVETFAPTELKVDGSLDANDNLKKIWPALKKHMPIYSVFKTDKSIDDKDKDVQDPMKQAIKESLAIQEIQDLLTVVEEKVRDISTQVAEATILKLESIDKNIAERMRTEFTKDPGWEKVFDLTLLNESGVPLNKRGSGIKRLVLLSFFQAQAERRQNDTGAPSIIYGIEEPETSQHPGHQQMIIESLIRLSEVENLQVLFTSHSSNLVRELPIEALIYVGQDQEGRRTVGYGLDFENGCEAESVISEIVKTLGVLPNPLDRVKVLVYVEGYHDIKALSLYSKILSDVNPEIPCLLDNMSVAFILTGGSTLKYWINEYFLRDLGKPEIHIYDSDVPEYVTAVAVMNAEGGLRKGFTTAKRELENYLAASAIEGVFRENGNPVVVPEITDDMDVPHAVARILHEASDAPTDWDGLEEKAKSSKASHCKRVLNSRAVELMTVELLRERNGYDEMKGWLNAIQEAIDA
ncbi:ATP-binding protein [bacterium]|nr:ATP-binding protein [bacterium]